MAFLNSIASPNDCAELLIMTFLLITWAVIASVAVISAKSIAKLRNVKPLNRSPEDDEEATKWHW